MVNNQDPKAELEQLAAHSYLVVRRLRDYRHTIHDLGLLNPVKSPTFWALWRDMQRLLNNLEPLLSKHSPGVVDAGGGVGLADELAKTQERLFWASALRDLAVDSLDADHLGEDLDL